MKKSSLALIGIITLTGFMYGFFTGVQTSQNIGYTDISPYLNEGWPYSHMNGNCQGCYLDFDFPNKKDEFFIVVNHLEINKTYVLITSNIGYIIFPKNNDSSVLFQDQVTDDSHMILFGMLLSNNTEVYRTIDFLTLENLLILEYYQYLDLL